jgi:hypothetical protein
MSLTEAPGPIDSVVLSDVRTIRLLGDAGASVPIKGEPN